MQNLNSKQYVINNSKIQPSSKYLRPSQVIPRSSSESQSNNQQLYLQKNITNESQYYPMSKVPQNKQQQKNSMASRYTSKNSIQQKQQILKKIRYINPLARLQYEDKMEEVYTKYTKLSKQTVFKKIKAKNQIAEFQEQQEDQNLGYDELLQYNFGKQKNNSNFHFQKEQENNQLQFCQLCDSIHNQSAQNHQIICTKCRSQQPILYSPYSDVYNKQSLSRIKNVISKIKESHYQQLLKCINHLDKNVNMNRSSIFVKNRQEIKEKIIELKRNNQQDEIFTKINNKVISLIQKT